jgi:hypothetical protein
VEGLALPTIRALAFSPDGEHFFSKSADGVTRVWEIFSGRQVPSAEAESFSFVFDSEGTELTSHSKDGTRKLLPAGDGSICLVDAASGLELARYYGFDSNEWISIVPEGFYNASFLGSSFLAAEAGKLKFRLDQFSGALYRPDLFTDILSGDRNELPLSLESLFSEDSLPPLLSCSVEENKGKLKVIITERKGGTGNLVLYRRSNEQDIPSGFIDVEKTAEKKNSEKKRTCYELSIEPSVRGEIGISVLNKSNTVESERFWTFIPEALGFPVGAAPPVLRVLLAAPDKADAEALGKFISLQNEGDLYSAVEVRGFFGGEFSRTGFIQTLEQFCAGANKNDAILLFLQGWGQADVLGNLRISPEKTAAPETEISGEDILKQVTVHTSDSFLILLDLVSGAPPRQMETALLRFRQKLGPRAMLAAFGTPEGESTLARSILEILRPDYSHTEAFISLVGNRFIGVEELLEHTSQSLAERGKSFLTFSPRENFKIADRFINTGELKFQTLTSGMLRIDQVDKNPVPLTFGETMFRILPEGSYIIDLIYRNGYRETKTVELRKKDSVWVIFNYTPPLYVGEFSGLSQRLGKLTSLGINLSELNPANFQKINREAMEGMGMSPHYVAYLSGGKFYKEKNYDKAIAEFSRAISLKADYADAYYERGNAWNGRGDKSKAAEDYAAAERLGFRR